MQALTADKLIQLFEAIFGKRPLDIKTSRDSGGVLVTRSGNGYKEELRIKKDGIRFGMLIEDTKGIDQEAIVPLPLPALIILTGIFMELQQD